MGAVQVENIDWGWESVLSPNSTGERDIGQEIHYYVLFIPIEVAPQDNIWQRIKDLTQQSVLGYRAALSPRVMDIGRYKNHLTIIVDTPSSQKDNVRECLVQNGLWNYVRYWKRRVRFDQNENPDGTPPTPRLSTGSDILEEY